MGVAPANGSPVISRSWKVPAVRSTRPLAWGDRANIIGMSPQVGVHPRQAALIQGAFSTSKFSKEVTGTRKFRLM